jgi:hypothetical protein
MTLKVDNEIRLHADFKTKYGFKRDDNREETVGFKSTKIIVSYPSFTN